MEFHYFMNKISFFLRSILNMSKHKSEDVKKCNPGNCCQTTNKITEDQIREEAYALWEHAGGVGDPDSFWFKAKEKLCKK